MEMRAAASRTLGVILLAAAPLAALGAGGGLHLDRAPDRSGDKAALQHGAKLFINYCLNCHGASYMRYNRLRDIGLTDEQIRKNLLFTAEKVGEPMRIATWRQDAKAWFGAAPPDLSVIARARASEFGSGADWLYTYLRSFYRDESRPTGWNNAVFPNVNMPFPFWDLQGARSSRVEEVRASTDKGSGRATGYEKVVAEYDEEGRRSERVEALAGAEHREGTKTAFGPARGGKLSQAEYDAAVADLVGFLVFMSEPVAGWRKQLGIYVLIALGVLAVLSYALKREYWKDVH
ncbi:MAG: cytochrome c1 [Rhodocyclaceae bacterium]